MWVAMMLSTITKRLVAELRRPSVIGKSGRVARLARNPVPFLAPWRFKILHVKRNLGLGDVLMCTPALREVKRRNPGCHIRFYTDIPGVVRGLPYIDEILPAGDSPPESISLRYEDTIPPRSHIARIIGDILGVRVDDVRPDCAVCLEDIEAFRTAWATLPRPHIVILRRAGRHTPNKDWPDSSWVALVNRLAQFGSVIEIGETASPPLQEPRENYVDIRGSTSVEKLAGAVAAADLFVGPCSGPMHVAAAVQTPSVVIYGGYEDPKNTLYPGNTVMEVPVACSPCWLRTPCPFDRKCLTGISVESVEKAVRNLWQSLA
jgi:ADP-heptose:LPS heptosyltransferase